MRFPARVETRAQPSVRPQDNEKSHLAISRRNQVVSAKKKNIRED